MIGIGAALQVIFGLILLAAGGEGLVRGAVSIARRLGLSELLIGLVLIGAGSSSPELLTSINAALAGTPGIAVGNVIGSNIANVLLTLASVAIVGPIFVQPAAVARDGIFAFLLSTIFFGLAFGIGEITRWMGIVLFLLLIAYLIFVWIGERKGSPERVLLEEEVGTHAPYPEAFWLSVLLAASGLALLIVGAELLVAGAVDLALTAGVSEAAIGLTLVALGTSIPEYVTAVVASVRGRPDIAFGTVIGSNIFNILGIIGATAMVTPISIPVEIGIATWALFVASAALVLFFATTQSRLTRNEGLIMFALYLGYMCYLLA